MEALSAAMRYLSNAFVVDSRMRGNDETGRWNDGVSVEVEGLVSEVVGSDDLGMAEFAESPPDR
jgi:hypothetical protein